MSILNYTNFINEKFLYENLREMKFVLSKRLIDILNMIDHPISNELLKLHNDLDFNFKHTFIDIHEEKDDFITFIQSNKASEILNFPDKETYDNFDKSIFLDINLNHQVYQSHRGETRIGRFINSVFGTSRFASELENFVRLYKAKYDQDEKFKLMKIVQGNDISHYYNCDNYQNSRGSLGSSCMSNVSSIYFEIYENNENIGMLVLFSNSNENYIKGRAIVWFDLIQPDGRVFMDRIYTNNSADEQLFIEYAIKNKWLYKSQQSIGHDIRIIDSIDGSSRHMKLLSQLKNWEYDSYPYLDTMCFYNPDNGKISNRSEGMQLKLQSTGGDAYDVYDNQDRIGTLVHSRYHDEDIFEHESKYCEFGDDWVLEEEAIKVFNSGNKYAVPGHPSIVHSYIPSIVDKHFEKDKCVWSDYLRTWVFKSSSRKVWLDKEKTRSVIDYKKRENDKFAKVGEDYYHINLVEKEGEEWKLK